MLPSTNRRDLFMRTVITILIAASTACLLGYSWAEAQVHYDKGRRIVQGIQLLQDSQDELAFYYLPQFPRLAQRDDGSFELLCLKYQGKDGVSSGGLFHALFEFGLPADMVDSIETELRSEVPAARIVGPVPLLQSTEEGGGGSFEVVSSVVREDSQGGLARTVLTSGSAPLMPGSRAVVASLLEPEGATLLWDSLTGPTSDVSVSVHAYYEAVVEGYNARVEANIDSVYDHFSELSNEQGLPEDEDEGIPRQGASPAGAAAAAAGSIVAGPGGAAIGAGLAAQGRRSLDPGLFTREYIATVRDTLIRDGSIQVTVLDRSQALDIESGAMDGLLSLITDKLVELMFDSTTGWAKEPPREQAMAFENIQGKTTEGWLAKVFGGRNRQYAADDLYVLKDRKDIRENQFSVILSRSTTVKVPVDASGNLGGVYDALEADTRYFRTVNLEDPAFQFREVRFILDGNFVDSFSDLVNFASVTVRKTYDNNPEVRRDLLFSLDEVNQGLAVQPVSYPRLGEADEEAFFDYEYRIEWSLRGGDTLVQPPDGGWIHSSSGAINVSPPLERRAVRIFVDRSEFEAHGVKTAIVSFATALLGETAKQRELHLRVDDVDQASSVVIYHDPGEDIAYQVTWITADGEITDDVALLDAANLDSTSLWLAGPTARGEMGKP